MLLFFAMMLAQGSFDSLVDRFFDECYFRYNPAEGTSDGFHQYDRELNTLRRSEIASQVAVLKNFQADFEHAAPSVDRDLVISHIRSQLLSLTEIRMWEKDPDRYSGS